MLWAYALTMCFGHLLWAYALAVCLGVWFKSVFWLCALSVGFWRVVSADVLAVYFRYMLWVYTLGECFGCMLCA